MVREMTSPSILYREEDEHATFFVKPFIFNRKAHTVKQDAVQSFCIG